MALVVAAASAAGFGSDAGEAAAVSAQVVAPPATTTTPVPSADPAVTPAPPATPAPAAEAPAQDEGPDAAPTADSPGATPASPPAAEAPAQADGLGVTPAADAPATTPAEDAPGTTSAYGLPAPHPPPPAPARAARGDSPVLAGRPPCRRCRQQGAAKDIRAPAVWTEPSTVDRPRPRAMRGASGAPTVADPTTSLAVPGAAPVGVPNFFIEKFRIPPFLLPIYQAAGIQYGIRWEVLAAINEIETDYGRNLDISSAGALGWMQFMPRTWMAYGVDANGDRRRDPFNPVDAIFAAARYLRAAGADTDLRKAIFAYNHADWYVESVLMRARLIGGLPDDLVSSLSGLTHARFPVPARARYARGATPPQRRGTNIFAAAGTPVIAVQDAVVEAIGRSRRLGRYVRLRDAHGNAYTYAHLERTARQVAVPRQRTQSRASVARELAAPTRDARPPSAASAGTQPPPGIAAARSALGAPLAPSAEPAEPRPGAKERLFANPQRSRSFRAGGANQILDAALGSPGSSELGAYVVGVAGLKRADVELKRLVRGRRVIGGTIIGRIGPTRSGPAAPHLRFEIRPAGRGAPLIDPKPILDGWKLLESTAIYRARGENPLAGSAGGATIGQILLMSKSMLIRRVLDNPRIELYSCGAADVRAGVVDRRVLAALEFLAAGGLRPTVTSLRCGHAFHTAGGNVSAHASGAAVDIAKINGIPVLGNQGAGSIVDLTVRRLLTLQGAARPDQIISLMTYERADNTLAMADHADHIHVGFRSAAEGGAARATHALLRPSQWLRLISRLGGIDNPQVRARPSRHSVPAVGRAVALASRRGRDRLPSARNSRYPGQVGR